MAHALMLVTCMDFGPVQHKLVRDFLKALETTTAVKRREISCNSGGDCCSAVVACRGRYKSLQKSSFHGLWLVIVVVCRSF